MVRNSQPTSTQARVAVSHESVGCFLTSPAIMSANGTAMAT